MCSRFILHALLYIHFRCFPYGIMPSNVLKLSGHQHIFFIFGESRRATCVFSHTNISMVSLSVSVRIGISVTIDLNLASAIRFGTNISIRLTISLISIIV